MRIQINIKNVLSILPLGSINSVPVETNYLTTIYDKHGNIVTDLVVNGSGDIEFIAGSGSTFLLKDDSDYGLFSVLSISNGNLILNVNTPFVFTSFSIGLKVSNGVRDFYKMFTLFGYDITIPVYLYDTNKALSTYLIVDNPLSNLKTIYKTNNTRVQEVKYTIGDKTKIGENVSLVIDRDSEVVMTSVIATVDINGTPVTYSHTSVDNSIAQFFIISPTLSIEKLTETDELSLGVIFKIKLQSDFSNQVKFTVDNTANTCIGKNYALVIEVYNNGGTLIHKHINFSTILAPIDLVSTITEDIEFNESGVYTIIGKYQIIGKDDNRNLTSYDSGEYVVAFESQIYPLGQKIITYQPYDKSNDFILIPAVSTISELNQNGFYREPYNTSFIDDGSKCIFIDPNVTILDLNGAYLTSVSNILETVVTDTIHIGEKFKLEQISINDYKVTNISEDILYVDVFKLEDNYIVSSENVSLSPNGNINITLLDGIYKFKFYQDEYSIEVVVISYPTVLNAQLDFIDMLMNDCIGKDIDYRKFYDFTAFNFLTDIFYKLLANQTEFYYIYTIEIQDEVINQLYTLNKILTKIKDYIATYDKRRY